MFRRIIQNGFFKNVALIASGTAGAQLINILASPIITRLYGPEAYGVLGTFNSLLFIIMPVSALSYPQAIVITKNRNQELGLSIISIIVSIILSIVLIVLIPILGPKLTKLMNMDEILKFLYFIPLALLFTTVLQIFQQLLTKNESFKIQARASLSQSMTANLIRVCGGLFFPTPMILIIVSTINSMIHCVYLVRGVLTLPVMSYSRFKSIDLIYLIKVAIKYSDFPRYRALQSFLNPLSQSLPIIFMASMFGPVIVGFYALSRSLLALPVSVIGNAVGSVFYPKFNKLYLSGGKLTLSLLKIQAFLLILGLLPFFIIVVFGPDIFTFVFGEEWTIAGEYARWISIWQFFALLNRPCNMVFNVFKMLKFTLAIEVFGLLLRVFSIVFIFWLTSNSTYVVVGFCLMGALVNLISIVSCIVSTYRYENCE